MNPAELRDQCLSFSGAEETFPFGPETSVFKVAGKMFALSQLGADSFRVSLKCEPQLAEALRGAHAAVLPGYHSPSTPAGRVLAACEEPPACRSIDAHTAGAACPAG